MPWFDHSRHRSAAVGVAAALLLAGASCGDDGEASPASTTTTLPDTGAGRTTSIGGLGGALVLLGTVLVFASARRSRASGRYLAR